MRDGSRSWHNLVPGAAETGLCTDREQKPHSLSFLGFSANGKGTHQRNGKFVTTSRRFCSGNLLAAFDKVRASDSSLVRYEGEGGMSGA